MLTLRRFRAMAESYGADLQRWPDALRSEAQALARGSAEARAVLDEARALDEAVAAAGAREDTALLWQPGAQDAALARLRSGVAGRIGHRPADRHFGWRLAIAGWRGAPELRWIGLATGGGAAILAGLLIGAMYASPPASDSTLATLLPGPLHGLVDGDG
jgi:hypothetical protein